MEEQRRLYRANMPDHPPRKGTSKYDILQNFCHRVEIILQTVSECEYQAATTFLEAPNQMFPKAVVFPKAGMVLGTFAEKGVALIQTDVGENSGDFIEQAIETFPNARMLFTLSELACATLSISRHTSLVTC